MNSPNVREWYTEKDFDSLGFHDSYVHGITWNRVNFSLSLDLDYIVEWVEPKLAEECYRFWISPAELRFINTSDVNLELDWTGLVPECQLDNIWQRQSRTTPNGSFQYYWELALSTPQGSVALWATGFKLIIQGPPVLSLTQYLERSQS